MINDDGVELPIDDEYEKPKKHLQVNGKTNNVTFKTARTSVWKLVLVEYFGKSKAHARSGIAEFRIVPYPSFFVILESTKVT